MPNVTPGIKLPKRDSQWQSANGYFTIAMPISGIGISNIQDTLDAMNSTIYKYFHDKYGVVEDTNTFQLAEKYKDLSNNSLKSQLKSLNNSS